MSSHVFRHKPVAPDELIGHVEADGRVFAAQFGPDRYAGRVDVASGRVWETHFGPDRLIGHVGLDTGKCFRAVFGPDEYVGHVDGAGRLYRHIPVAVDEYLGRIDPMPGFAHAGAALLLLVLPKWEAEQPETGALKSAKDEGPEANGAPE
jgi:hypothetical protein